MGSFVWFDTRHFFSVAGCIPDLVIRSPPFSLLPSPFLLSFYPSSSFCYVVLNHHHRQVPKVGMMTILMNDYPILKKVLVGALGIYILLHRE